MQVSHFNTYSPTRSTRVKAQYPELNSGFQLPAVQNKVATSIQFSGFFSKDKNKKELLEAAKSGNLPLVQQLVTDKKVDINCKSSILDGKTPLHKASAAGKLNVVQWLINHPDIEANIKSGTIGTPLHGAVQNGHLEVVKFLVNHPKIDPNIQNIFNTVLHDAVKSGNKEITEFLVNHPKVDPQPKGKNKSTPLHDAAEFGHLELVQIFVNSGRCDISPIDEHGLTPIGHAAQNKHDQVVKYLLAKGGEVSEGDISMASGTELTKLLKSSRASSFQAHTALFEAIKIGDLLRVKKIIADNESLIDSKDRYSLETPLHKAVESEHLEIVQFLANHPKGKVNTEDRQQKTPLQKAVGKKHIPIIEFLVNQPKTDVNYQGLSGSTALHDAAELGSTKIAACLMKYPFIEINCEDFKGRTPLHLASAANKIGMVKYLTGQPKINLHCISKNGKSILGSAASYGNKNIIRYLQSLGLKANKEDISSALDSDIRNLLIQGNAQSSNKDESAANTQTQDDTNFFQESLQEDISPQVQTPTENTAAFLKSQSINRKPIRKPVSEITTTTTESPQSEIGNPFEAMQELSNKLMSSSIAEPEDDHHSRSHASTISKEEQTRGRSASPAGSILRAVSPGKESQKLHRILMTEKPLTRYGGNLDELLSYQSALSVANEIKHDLQQGRPIDDIIDALEEQNVAVIEDASSHLTPLQKRDIILFWNRVSKLVFDGKTVTELRSDKPAGFNAIQGMDALKRKLDSKIVSRLDRFHPNQVLRSPLTEQDFPSGVIFYGPPGSGKSFVAKRLMEELQLNKLEKSQKDVISSYKGDSAKNLGTIYDEAETYAPSGIIFDEGESLMVDREDPKADQHDKNLTNQMLQELEKAPKRGIFTAFTTNHVDSIDPAVLERKDRIALIHEFSAPDSTARRDLIRAFLKEQCKNRSELHDCPFPYTERDIDKLVKESGLLSIDNLKGICMEAFANNPLGYPTVDQLLDEIEDANQRYKSIRKAKRK